jgi:MSHA biogenesis protein MshP
VMRRRPRSEQGFSLVAAIFVVLVLAALGIFALRIGITEQQTAAFDLSIARAQAAADSGIEFGANQALKAASCPAKPTSLGISGFTITVTCAISLHKIAGTPYSAYFLTSTAQRGTYGAPDFVSRAAKRTVTDAPP